VVGRAVRALRGAAALDPSVHEVTSEAERILGELAELGGRLEREEERLAEGILDPEAIEARLDLIHRLKRRHRTDLPGLIGLREQLHAKVRSFDPSGHDLDQAERAHDERLQAFERRLDALLAHRSDRYAAFETDVGARLAKLGFNRSALKVRLADSGRAVVDPAPIPHLEFAFRPNPGEGERPLRKIASGGAVPGHARREITDGGQRPGRVLVFDEVDRGSGAVGEEVGRLLKRSRNGGRCSASRTPSHRGARRRHFEVSKSVTPSARACQCGRRREGRVEELARLLAGDRATERPGLKRGSFSQARTRATRNPGRSRGVPQRRA
jgi:DNA repair protein RecN (Recombination protein N)